jgi:hypothetical protein
VNLDAHMMGDQTNDALAVGGAQRLAGVGDALAELIEPKAAVGVEHDFDDGRVVEPPCDRRPESGAQHPRAA